MLKKILRMNYELELLSGLHIGGSTDVFDIGGADSTVIKNPMTGEPYIPGSSIKGKIRSVLTMKYGQIDEKEQDYTLEDNKVFLNLFQPVEDLNPIQVSRAIFRDAVLTRESLARLQQHLGEGIFTEIKAENKINSLKGKADNPRLIERVPASAVFEGEIILQIFDGDNEEELRRGLQEGIRLLGLSYLGGSGTRGYGKVAINDTDFEEVS